MNELHNKIESEIHTKQQWEWLFLMSLWKILQMSLREVQLCATGTEKVHKFCPFYSILFLPDIIYVLYKI